MARLGGIPITDKELKCFSGAAFLLTKSSKNAEKIKINNSVFLEVKPNVNHAIVRFNNAITPEDVLKQGHEYAQQGLDLLSILGKEHLAIRDTDDEYIIWWYQNDQQILRVVTVETINAEAFPVQITAHDEEGNEIKTPIVEPKHHLAFRYFRLSQITEDLYDAYRNMYLAFELLLSSQYPKKGREIDWLKDSLDKANSSLNLTTLSTEEANSVSSIIKIIYYDARNPLFHAKQDQNFYSPQNYQHQIAVKKALKLLMKIVLKMSELWYNARYDYGRVNPKWLLNGYSPLLSKARMLISEDDSLFDPNQEDLSHNRYKTTIWLNTKLLLNDTIAEKGLTILGKLGLNKLNNIICRRFEVVGEEIPMFVHLMKDELELSGIDQLECQFDVRVNNINQPKNLYPR